MVSKEESYASTPPSLNTLLATPHSELDIENIANTCKDLEHWNSKNHIPIHDALIDDLDNCILNLHVNQQLKSHFPPQGRTLHILSTLPDAYSGYLYITLDNAWKNRYIVLANCQLFIFHSNQYPHAEYSHAYTFSETTFVYVDDSGVVQIHDRYFNMIEIKCTDRPQVLGWLDQLRSVIFQIKNGRKPLPIHDPLSISTKHLTIQTHEVSPCTSTASTLYHSPTQYYLPNRHSFQSSNSSRSSFSQKAYTSSIGSKKIKKKVGLFDLISAVNEVTVQKEAKEKNVFAGSKGLIKEAKKSKNKKKGDVEKGLLKMFK